MMMIKKSFLVVYLGVELNSDHVIMIFFLGVYTFHVSHLNLCCFWLVKGNWLDIDPFIQETKKKKEKLLIDVISRPSSTLSIYRYLIIRPSPSQKKNKLLNEFRMKVSLELNNLTTKSNLDFSVFVLMPMNRDDDDHHHS